MVCREVRGAGQGTSRRGRRGSRTVIRLADHSGQAVFPLTWGCGACAMQAQESRTRSRITGSTLIWEISVNRMGRPQWSTEWEAVGMLFAYISPDAYLPVASAVAAALGFVMMVGRAPFRLAAKTWRHLVKKIHS